jgi:hypothetical protein
MQRIVILGRGGAGKSVAARKLSNLTGLPHIELDRYFWQPGLAPLPRDKWVEVQKELASGPRWIMDGDLGPQDVLAVRLAAADTILLFDLPLRVCAWRALRRGREKWSFWRWLIGWHWLSRPRLFTLFAEYPDARLYRFRSSREFDRFLVRLSPSDET